MTPKTQTRTVDREKLKKQLIAFGKKKGHVTYDELHELLPPDLIDPEELGEWEKTLVDEGVQVLSREEAKDARSRSSRPARSCRSATRRPRTSPRAPTTPCACTCARWARCRCSPARARSRSPSASSRARCGSSTSRCLAGRRAVHPRHVRPHPPRSDARQGRAQHQQPGRERPRACRLAPRSPRSTKRRRWTTCTSRSRRSAATRRRSTAQGHPQRRPQGPAPSARASPAANAPAPLDDKTREVHVKTRGAPQGDPRGHPGHEARPQADRRHRRPS
jgi:hypothetical protein